MQTEHTLSAIDWNSDVYNITDGFTMELDSHTGLSRADRVCQVVTLFEDNTPCEYYVYCFKFGDNKWYVGETEHLAQRISTHSNERDIQNIETVEGVSSRENAREREREMSYEIAIEKCSTDIYGGR